MYAILWSVFYYPLRGEMESNMQSTIRSGVHYEVYLNKNIHMYNTWSGHIYLLVQGIQ